MEETHTQRRSVGRVEIMEWTDVFRDIDASQAAFDHIVAALEPVMARLQDAGIDVVPGEIAELGMFQFTAAAAASDVAAAVVAAIGRAGDDGALEAVSRSDGELWPRRTTEMIERSEWFAEVTVCDVPTDVAVHTLRDAAPYPSGYRYAVITIPARLDGHH